MININDIYKIIKKYIVILIAILSQVEDMIEMF